MYELHEVIRHLQLLGSLEQLILSHGYDTAYLTLHLTHVADSLDNIACTRLTLGTYHCRTFGNTAESLTKVAGTAHEGNIKLGLVDVVDVIGW